MIFTDLRFLLLFGACGATFVAVPRAHRNAAIACWGLVFYFIYAGAALAIVIALVLATWVADRRRYAWLAGIAIVTALLVFKLAEAGTVQVTALAPGAGQLMIPLGLSYLSFELLHVVIERQRGRLQHVGLVDLVAYAFFLPCRIAGPIRRFPEFMASLERADPGLVDLYEGLLRILTGLAKKLIIADTLALTGAEIGHVQAPGHAWILVLAYGVRIYVDFSAYSDLAIGFARILGIRVPENFSFPYLATNIRDFWSRWHITLSQWVRDYIFMPTGRRLFATALRSYPSAIAAVSYLVTFAVVGVWHGMTLAFLVWGLYHGALLSVHHAIQAHMPATVAASAWYRSRASSAVAWAVTFLCVTIGWVPFMTDLATAARLLSLMFLGGAR